MTWKEKLVKEQKTREMPSRSRVFMYGKFFGVATASDSGDVTYVHVRIYLPQISLSRCQELTTSRYTRDMRDSEHPEIVQFFRQGTVWKRCCARFESIGDTL